MYTGALLLFALFLVLLNGMFVAAEFGFVKARKTRIELLAARGDKRAQSALLGMAHLDAYLSVCQLGITLASLGLGWIGEPAVARILRPILEIFSITNQAVVSSLSMAIGFAIITFLHVVFGELAPKSISIQKAEKTVLILARPMRVAYLLWYPVVVILNGISNAFLRLIGIRPASEAEQSHSPEELRMLIMESSKGGKLDASGGRMLDNIFSFYHRTAKDIMTHRMDTVLLHVGDNLEQVMRVLEESGHTRFPVYDDSKDSIVGFIHAKDLLSLQKGASLRDLLRDPAYVQETVRLDKLLQDMQAKRRQFCVVVDEYGDWQGILTMEDIVEAIVGEIQDEFDNEEPDVVAEAGGSYLVSGDLSLDELEEHLPLQCPIDTDMYKKLAAHFMDSLGEIPKAGDAIELCNKKFTVTDMDRYRVRRVRVEDLPPQNDETDTPPNA